MSNNTIGEGTENSENDEQQGPNINHTNFINPLEHRLQYTYWLWFRKPGNGLRNNTLEGYEQTLKLVGEFSTVEQWWALYSHLARPNELPPDTSFNLFKHGIKPIWEDQANINGGKWVIRLRKGLAERAWEDLCMAVLGEQFMVGPEICGIGVGIRFQEDIISVWHKTSSDQVASARIRDTLRRVLHLQPGTNLEYKTHTKCLRALASSSGSTMNSSSYHNNNNSRVQPPS